MHACIARVPSCVRFRDMGAHACRLKALLSQCEPTQAAFTDALLNCGMPCTLPLITKLVSKFNKSGQWRRGLALCWSLQSIGLEVSPPPRACSDSRPANVPKPVCV